MWAVMKADKADGKFFSWVHTVFDTFEEAKQTEQSFNEVYKRWVNPNKSPYFLLQVSEE